jgi:phosphoribosyl-ATP pyrophosphohydrolase
MSTDFVIYRGPVRSADERYHAASVTMEERDVQIEAVSDELEQDLRL